MVHATGHWMECSGFNGQANVSRSWYQWENQPFTSATGATRLFEANVPKKLTKERTGHKSLDALRLYERTSSEQQNEYPI